MWLKVILFIVPLMNVKALDKFLEDNSRVHLLSMSSQNEDENYFKFQRNSEKEMMGLFELEQRQGYSHEPAKEGKDINNIAEKQEYPIISAPSAPRETSIINKRLVKSELEPHITVQHPKAAPGPLTEPVIIEPAPKIVNKNLNQPEPTTKPIGIISANQPEPALNQVAIIPEGKHKPLLKPVIAIPAPKPVLVANYIMKTPVQAVTYKRPAVNVVNNRLVDYECRNANGYFTTQNDCHRFVECKEYKAYYYECPDGMAFNRNTIWPNYPCVKSIEVQCQANIVERVPRLTSDCPSHNGLYALQDSDCSNYISCQEGVATVMNCPKGLVFNPTVQSCDWLENVPSCRPNVFSGFTCPSIEDEDEDVLTKFRYGESCAEYIACHRGVPRLLKCDTGLAFDNELQRCVDADLVESCEYKF